MDSTVPADLVLDINDINGYEVLAKDTACECCRAIAWTISCFVTLRIYSLRDGRLDAARI
jgi:hypothetical protein